MSSDLLDPGADELSRACRIDSACDRFETAWKSGNLPRIEDYLDEIAAPERLVLACELIQLDIHYRRLAGLTCLVNEYDSRFPELDPTWLAGVISSGTGGSPTPSASHPGLTTANNGETIPPLSTGSLQSFGDYEIHGVIGESGMGVVYKAWQRSLNRFVALKTIRHGRGLSRSAVERFRAEAEMAAHLDHPNILPIYEVNEHEGQPYFTMKLIEGVDLARLPPGFTEDQRAVARLVATAARAVYHAHQRGILHRDLKPANILLEWPAGTDRPPVPHVADFGLAKRLDVDMHLSLEDGLVGTPVYMAPEQALRKSDLTTAVDVHGLGAVLYFLLTGQPPFKAETILETVQQVIEREPVRPRSLKPDVNRDLEIICLTCLEKRPQDRLRSAEEVAEELERWLAGKPIKSRSASTPEKILKWVRRRPAVAALLAVSMVAMLALVGVGVGLWYSAQLHAVNDGLSEANREKEVAYTELEQEKSEVEKQRQRARRFLYVSQINLADRAYKEGKPGLALQLLETVRPQEMGGEDLRGPEWYHLWNACSGYAYALSAPSFLIIAMEFSPNGQWLAASAADGHIIIWDTREEKVRHTFYCKSARVAALQFTNDSKVLLVTCKKTPIGAWDADSGRQLAAPPDSPNVETDPGVSRALDNLAQMQQEREKVLSEPPYHVCSSLALTPDNRIAVADFGRNWQDSNPPPVSHTGQVIVVDRIQNRTVHHWQPGVLVYTVAISSCGRLVGWAGEDSVIQVKDLEAREPGQFFSFNSTPRLLAFSHDRRYLASTHADRTIRVWQLQHSFPSAKLDTQRRVNNVVFSPVEWQLAAGCAGTTNVWAIPSWKRIYSLPDMRGPGGSNQRLAYSVDGRWLSDGLRVIEIATGKEVSLVQKGDEKAMGTAFSPDGKLVATASYTRVHISHVLVWEAATGNLLQTLKATPEWPVSVAFSPDGKLLAAGSATGGFRSGGVRVWEVSTGKEVHSYLPTNLSTYSVAFSPDGRWLAVGRGTNSTQQVVKGEIRIFDTQTWAEVMSLEGHSSCVWWVAFSPDGRRLASAAGLHSSAAKTPGEIKIWDLTVGQELLTLKGHTGCVRGVSFSPNGKVLASGSADGTIRLWGDLASLKP
jgi:WD40 repeat protein